MDSTTYLAPIDRLHTSRGVVGYRQLSSAIDNSQLRVFRYSVAYTDASDKTSNPTHIEAIDGHRKPADDLRARRDQHRNDVDRPRGQAGDRL